ncbi:MAG: ABC transporter substrate-binding protein [Candidatus Caldarchaeales archaeon]|jgi:polar amino acid transport system substrate-binding protein|nr:ABC transporter substrate-binding protein [Candidatus Caldarchaeales archaeon]
MRRAGYGAAWLVVMLVIGAVIGAAGVLVYNALTPPQQPPSQLDEIKSRGKLIVGTSADWPPFEYIDSAGRYAGIDMALAEKIARELGVQLEVKDMKFAALIEALKGGQIDIILADIHPTAEREKVIDFTKNYYIAYDGSVLVLKKGAQNIRDEQSLKGKRIGVQLGTIQEEWAKEKLGASSEIVSFDRVFPEMVMALKRGDLDAIIVGDIIGEVLAKRDPELQVVFKVGSLGGAAIGVRQGSEELKYVINKLIEEMIDSGEMSRLFEEEIGKWLGA